MTLAGTRPPTVDEWDKYELHHRARLATKPGLTGMWQVSGRSNITDFEEVVKLDKQYMWIKNIKISNELKCCRFANPDQAYKDFIAAQQSEDKRINIDLVPADEERRASRIAVFE